jgi:hypothetical protein
LDMHRTAAAERRHRLRRRRRLQSDGSRVIEEGLLRASTWLPGATVAFRLGRWALAAGARQRPA